MYLKQSKKQEKIGVIIHTSNIINSKVTPFVYVTFLWQNRFTNVSKFWDEVSFNSISISTIYSLKQIHLKL